MAGCQCTARITSAASSYLSTLTRAASSTSLAGLRLQWSGWPVLYSVFAEPHMQLDESWHVSHINNDPSTRTAWPHPQPT